MILHFQNKSKANPYRTVKQVIAIANRKAVVRKADLALT